VRLLADQPLQLAGKIRASAEGGVGLDPLLQRRDAQVFQPASLDPRERLLELRQRRPAPERQRRAQQLSRALGPGRARLSHKPF
jgi:hypothetical protein